MTEPTLATEQVPVLDELLRQRPDFAAVLPPDGAQKPEWPTEYGAEPTGPDELQQGGDPDA